MTYSSPPANYEPQAAANRTRGSLFGYALPPLAAVLVSILLVFGVTRIDTAQAGEPQSAAENSSRFRQGIAPLFTPEVQAWEEEIMAWSVIYQLDPNLIATVMQIESCGFIDATSGAGAMGLFQVMPYHFQEGEDPYLPDINAQRGLKYLRMSQEAGGGSTRMTLAGYNGGINGVGEAERYWPYETQRYVYWGLGIYQDARSGLEFSPRLQEWLDFGGSALCKKARQSQN